MDKEFEININDKKAVKYLKILIITLLAVIEIIVCAQYIEMYAQNGDIARLAAVVICSAILTTLVAVDSFIKSSFPVKMMLFGFDSAFLLAICIITGNSYLSVLYCLVLTQFYVSVNDLKKNMILFAVSCFSFAASFVIGWCILNYGASLLKSFVQIFGDLLFGVSILAIHCVITNFVLKFYKNNVQLRKALKEADESRVQLEDMYEQLSQTAVFEERNRIAKDIHDNAGHSMTTVIMQTEAAKLLIDSNPEEAKNRIISANMQAKNALDQMRESVHLLAGRMQNNSLKDEINDIIAQTIDGTELKIRTDLEDVSTDSERARFITNAVKECLANGIRHGGATAFYIEMKKSFSDLTLLISDNGRGVEGDVKEGFGLRGIREKVEKLGGRCSFSGEADEGFEVEISLPTGDKQ